MPKRSSLFDGESYKGYKVSIRLVREGLDEYEPAKISCPKDIYKFMEALRESDRERIYSLHLDTKKRVIGLEEVSCGSLCRATTTPREVFKSAMLSSCDSIILVHNHPSGDSEPSQDDIQITKNLCRCGELLGIEVTDSIIIGQDSFYSFKERGML